MSSNNTRAHLRRRGLFESGVHGSQEGAWCSREVCFKLSTNKYFFNRILLCLILKVRSAFGLQEIQNISEFPFLRWVKRVPLQKIRNGIVLSRRGVLSRWGSRINSKVQCQLHDQNQLSPSRDSTWNFFHFNMPRSMRKHLIEEQH